MTEVSEGPACAEKARLLRLYETHTTAFATAVTTLNERMGTASREQYDDLRRRVEEERLASEPARLAVEEHVARHGC
jgi:hypothetical protein